MNTRIYSTYVYKDKDEDKDISYKNPLNGFFSHWKLSSSINANILSDDEYLTLSQPESNYTDLPIGHMCVCTHIGKVK